MYRTSSSLHLPPSHRKVQRVKGQAVGRVLTGFEGVSDPSLGEEHVYIYIYCNVIQRKREREVFCICQKLQEFDIASAIGVGLMGW